MKLQNLSIIFLVIMIPIMLVVSYYIQLQIDTITLQTTYDSKLIAATKDAIEAFEINTVEWNNKFSDVSGSKRRDIEASINTFMTTLADGLGVSGINREYIEGYIPAILYTLNDGYYIYTPTKTYETLKDEDGVDKVDEDGNILYDNGTADGTTDPRSGGVEEIYEHTLLPLISYSEQVGKITINYTLDNYIKVSGDFSCDVDYANYGGDKSKPLINTGDNRQGSSSYVQEEGHLVYNSYNMTTKSITDIWYKNDSIDVKIEPETLSENICYIDDSGNYIEENFIYIYIEDSQGDKTKLYYSTTPGATGNNWFTMNSKDKRVFLSDDVTNVTQYVYKKVSLPGLGEYDPNGVSTLGRYINFYQVLNGDVKGNWYADWNQDGELPPSEQVTSSSYYTDYGLDSIDQTEDCSAIKYYVQGYYFTRWVYNKLGIDKLKVTATNNPEDVDSAFYKHKQEVIKNQINNSLAQAIRNYAGESAQDYRLPELTLNDWDQILSNVSMVTFMQQIPVGFKTYNNYAIATSTNNREVVDPDEIYFINDADDYYHRCYCDETFGTTNLKGYRSVDFVERMGYTYEDAGEEKTEYYFLHNGSAGDAINASMACYYCLINRADYTETENDSLKDYYTIAYNTALARERYKSKQDVILAKEYAEFEVEKKAIRATGARGTVALTDGEGNPIPGAYVEIGDTITWEITVKNKGKAGGKAYFYDKMPTGLEITNVDDVKSKFIDDDIKNITKNGIYGNIYVDQETSKPVQVNTVVTGDVNLGQLTNIVIIKNEETSDISIDQASADVKAEKTVTITTGGETNKANIIFVLDQSSSIIGDISGIRKAATEFINRLDGSTITLISFAQNAQKIDDIKQYGGVLLSLSGLGMSTNYLGALTSAEKYLTTEEGVTNYIIFMTDGGPTASQWPDATADFTRYKRNRCYI